MRGACPYEMRLADAMSGGTEDGSTILYVVVEKAFRRASTEPRSGSKEAEKRAGDTMAQTGEKSVVDAREGSPELVAEAAEERQRCSGVELTDSSTRNYNQSQLRQHGHFQDGVESGDLYSARERLEADVQEA